MMVRQTIYAVAGFLAGLGAALTINSYSEGLRLEGGVGRAQHSLAGDDIWWQSAYWHQETLRSSAWGVGGSIWYPSNGGYQLGLRARYEDFGHTSIRALWVSDEDWFSGRRPAPGAVGTGEGHAATLTLGPVVEKPFGDIALQIEGGAAFVRSTWREQVKGLENGTDQCGQLPDCSSNQKRLTWYAGVGVRYGYALLMLRRYHNPVDSQDGKGGWNGIGGHPIWTATINFSVPL